MTVSLPPKMVEQVEVIRKVEHRTRSELVREALRQYFSTRFPVELPLSGDSEAIRLGRQAYKRGDYVSVDGLRDELGGTRRRPRKKRA